MLLAIPQDPDYRIDVPEDVKALIDGLAFNVQDPHWLIYCTLGGHAHCDLPDIDTKSGFSMPEFYAEAA